MEKNPLDVTEPICAVNFPPALFSKFIDTQVNNVILDSNLNRIPAAVCRRLSGITCQKRYMLLEKGDSKNLLERLFIILLVFYACVNLN
jgi:hypothetical protein